MSKTEFERSISYFHHRILNYNIIFLYSSDKQVIHLQIIRRYLRSISELGPYLSPHHNII